jgi:hypothetical protein
MMISEELDITAHATFVTFVKKANVMTREVALEVITTRAVDFTTRAVALEVDSTTRAVDFTIRAVDLEVALEVDFTTRAVDLEVDITAQEMITLVTLPKESFVQSLATEFQSLQWLSEKPNTGGSFWDPLRIRRSGSFPRQTRNRTPCLAETFLPSLYRSCTITRVNRPRFTLPRMNRRERHGEVCKSQTDDPLFRCVNGFTFRKC